MKLSHALSILFLGLASLGCAATSGSGPSASGDASKPPAGGGKEEADSADEKIAKAQREVEYAKLELEIAKLSVAAETREADQGVLEANQKLDAVRKDRDVFKSSEGPVKLADKQLDVDRTAQYMEEQRQELEELEKMYKQEEFASLTKELVLTRGKAKLEFARRGLELAKKGQDQLAGHEVPKRQLELDQSVEKAEKTLAEANAKKERGALESKLKLLKAEHHVDEAARALEKTKKKDAPKPPEAHA